jgi:uncharacterized protein YndB with AHSA1/START domain
MTVEITTTRTFAQPADAVWVVLADYERDPEWRAGVETMAPSTTGTAQPGTTTAEVLHLGGRTYRNGGVVTAVDAGRRLEWRTTSGADAQGARTVEAIDAGTCRVTLDLSVRPRGIERVLQPVLRRVLARGMAADLERLAVLVADGAGQVSRR